MFVMLTPNWRLSHSPFPTDTLRPPLSFPIEWAYIRGNSTRGIALDAYRSGDTLERTIHQIRALAPRFVIISTSPSYLFWRCPPLSVDVAAAYSRALEKLEIPTVIVGPHGISEPSWTFKRTRASFVFRGEIEAMFPIQRLIDAIATRGKMEGLSGPNEIVGKVSEPADLSLADYSEMGNGYPAHTWITAMASDFAGERGALVEAARGCAWDCDFCLRDGFRRTLRHKSIKIFRAEIQQLSAIGIGYVYFIDETFGYPWSHYRQIVGIMHAAGIVFGMQTRPDIWNEDRVEYLRQHGCVYAEVGVEAVYSDQLARLGKFGKASATITKARHIERGIPFVGLNSFDFAVPELGLIRDAERDRVRDAQGIQALPFIPYPHTPLGDRAIGKYRMAGQVWDKAAALHSMFSIEARTPAVKRMLRWVWMRQAFVWTINVALTLWSLTGVTQKTRHELRTADDFGTVDRDPGKRNLRGAVCSTDMEDNS